ncbi:hypothetical protein [Synechococcus sp. PCC 6312]|uniref:hypothetical protein n=1 Tax=Synechococcus sp. (strain ATCC 27167 / PCC 6312) TaxID=195253 RepID=UPI00029EE1C6|nr:hypothetical protein [Synechococcus sp. PCC 6312]AFY61401.1 hypothetical protein Syn6312_2286 [Synechococcus sp. PCC 6312]
MEWGSFQFFSKAALTRIKSTAMAPGLWLVGTLGFIGLGAAVFFINLGAQALAWACFSLVAFTVVSIISVYLFFAFTDPDRLQSEEFVIRNRVVSLIGEKGKGFTDNLYALENVIDLSPPLEKRVLDQNIYPEKARLDSSQAQQENETFNTDSLDVGGDDDGKQ